MRFPYLSGPKEPTHIFIGKILETGFRSLNPTVTLLRLFFKGQILYIRQGDCFRAMDICSQYPPPVYRFPFTILWEVRDFFSKKKIPKGIKGTIK